MIRFRDFLFERSLAAAILWMIILSLAKAARAQTWQPGPDGIDHRQLIRVHMMFRNVQSAPSISEMDNDLIGIATFYWEASYHRLQFNYEAHIESFPDMDVPIQTAGPYAGMCDTGKIAQLLAQRGYPTTDRQVHIWADAPCGFSWAPIGGRMIFGGYPVHELGHNMGFRHTSIFDYCDGVSDGTVPSDMKVCQTQGYNGMPDPMANLAGDFDAFHKRIAGWLDVDQMMDVSSDGSFVLNAVTIAGGLHGLRLPSAMTDEDAQPMDAYVEYRAAVGLDANPAVSPGVYVYFARVFPGLSQTDTFGYGGDDLRGRLAKPGDSILLSGDGAHIVLVSTGASSAVVQIHFGDTPIPPPSACVISPPTGLSFEPVGPSSVMLHWTATAGATEQAVSFAGAAEQSLPPGQAQFGPIAVAANATYSWTVREKAGTGCSKAASSSFTMPTLFRFSYDPTTLPAGPRTLTVKAYAKDGQVAQSSVSFHVDGSGGGTAPTAAILSPQSGSQIGGVVTVEAGACEGATKVELYDGDPTKGGKLIGVMSPSAVRGN